MAEAFNRPLPLGHVFVKQAFDSLLALTPTELIAVWHTILNNFAIRIARIGVGVKGQFFLALDCNQFEAMIEVIFSSFHP